MQGAVWEPSPQAVERSMTTRFMAAHGIASYDSLLERSVNEPEWFWSSVVEFLGIPFQRSSPRVIDASDGVPWTRWWPDGALNLSAACLDRWADDPQHAGAIAFIHESEDGQCSETTFAELRDEVAALAGALRLQGVKAGDRVGLLLGLADGVHAFLAVARLGAVAVPIFSGFGPAAITARLVDGGCRLLVTAATASRRGQSVALARTAEDAARAAEAGGGGAGETGEAGAGEAGAGEAGAGGQVQVQVVCIDDLRALGALPAEAVITGTEDPVLLAYTSGTTGQPKGAVHVHGGFTVKLAQEGAFQADLRPGDRACWLTDMGWIMGPWITIAALANGATLVVYDGAPDWPDAGRVWQLVEQHRITFLGLSPTLVRSLAAAGDHHVVNRNRSSLRAFGSTGEPWTEDAWWWLYTVGGDGQVPIVNLSGGTEVGACLLSVNLLQGCAPCSVGGPSLGVAVDVVDDAGRSLCGSGQVGELVVRGAWPGMTRGIWGAPERYLETYWSKFEGMWWHGDWAEVDDDGWWYLHGRSDDTLNIAGKRIGPAEIESAALHAAGVTAVAAVGLPHPVKGEVVGLWCVPSSPTTMSSPEEQQVVEVAVVNAVVEAFGKPFRPAHIAFVAGLPQTRSAKVVRRAIRARAIGVDAGDLSTLEDPAVLDAIELVDLGAK